MANEITLTVIGNLTADPELRYTKTGTPVADFTVASTPRSFRDGQWHEGDPLFLRCTIWRQPAEHVADSLKRGDRVVVTGRLQQRSYETREGEKRTTFELLVDEVGASLRYATAQITKNDRYHAANGEGTAGVTGNREPVRTTEG